MVMYFRQIRDAITTTLGDAAAGRYRVVGYQEKGVAAESILDSDRLVRAYYSSGNIKQSSSALRGPFNHDMTFKIELEASKRTEVDLSVLQDPSASSAAIIAAWAALKPAEQAADESLDELWDHVFNAIMDAREIDLGLSFPIGTRWLSDFSKDTVMTRGEYAVLTGTASLTCMVDEKVQGLEPLDFEVIDENIDLVGDDVEKTGVIVEV